MKNTLAQKINLLNKATLNSVLEENKDEIIKIFTDVGIQILEADFGSAWWYLDNKYQLAYKSPQTPADPVIPKRKKNTSLSTKTTEVSFDSNVTKTNYESSIHRYMKSYIIIPVNFGDHPYGSIVLYHNKQHKFINEELELSYSIANIISQSITIRWLIEREQSTITLAEKQKTMEISLAQEKLKNEFLANATHELRTPLAIMKGNVDLAMMDKGNLKLAQRTLKEVNEEINILGDILKDLSLLTSAGQNVKHVMSATPVNILELLKNLSKRLQGAARDRHISITIKTKNTQSFRVIGEQKYLEKLFVNLIKNSITYGKDKGKTVIELSKEKNMLKVKVIDNGIGISKEDLSKIFDRFYRGDKAHTHKSYGENSGLGLPIAKWAAELHNGSITAESVHGKGSTFTVTLPLHTK